MPRRPRPAHRSPAKRKTYQHVDNITLETARSNVNSIAQPPKHHLNLKRRHDELEANEDEEPDEREQSSEIQDDISESDDDADVPRVSQWVDEDLLEKPASGSSDEHDSDMETGSSNLKYIQKDMSSIPLGALRKAQKALQNRQADDSEDAEDSESDSDSDVPSAKGKEKRGPEWSAKPRSDIGKRSSKHAPMEMSSKKPVTRRRQVVSVPTLVQGDPRFLQLAGDFSPKHFSQQYGFLAEMHSNELQTLRDDAKRMRRLVTNAPRHLRAEREQELERMERAIKRVESIVNKEKRDKIERDALDMAARGEKEKRKQGKVGWWMKKSDKKDLLVRARYEALSAEGGNRAVKKAVEKKRKKIGQKEKKTRPFAPGKQAHSGRSSGLSDRPAKRRKV